MKTIGKCFGLAAAMFVGGMVHAEVSLPANYTRLEWVASDGTQELDIGVPVSDSLQVEADIVFHLYHGDVSLGAQDGLYCISNSTFIFIR